MRLVTKIPKLVEDPVALLVVDGGRGVALGP
jgi:hypothetical protein